MGAAYYNEHDPKSAAWLRELIRAGELPPGEVDESDIQFVSSSELSHYTQHHFFAGIGGWPLALRLTGWPDDQPVCTGSCPCQPAGLRQCNCASGRGGLHPVCHRGNPRPALLNEQ